MAQMLDIEGTPRQRAAPERLNSFKKLTNFLGAGLSVALIAGVVIWGYKLLVRDVSGIPVVRAAEGPMRELPEDPGGSQAAHQGLAVNAVAAEGFAEAPADRLILAPAPIELSLEDETAGPVTSEAVIEPVPGVAVENATEADRKQEDSVEALVARIAAGISPIDDSEQLEEPVIPELPVTKVEGGLGKSLRPRLRPATLGQPPASVSAFAGEEIDMANIPAGTFMAQLGAFDSAAIARGEWDRLSGRYDGYLTGKSRVIQKASSGGRVFYRLRAMGFSDINDARRFCSALIAEGAECISVVAR